MRRSGLTMWIVGFGVAALGLVACAAFGTDATKSQPAAADAGGEAEPKEDPVRTFSCGTTDCLAGSQACCQSMGTFGCYGIDAGGCPSLTVGDAGPDAAPAPPPPALLCNTYRNCETYQQCCWRADVGSSCQPECPNGHASLCTVKDDYCSYNTDCNPLANSPGANIGQCTGYGGSSGGWGGWGK